MRDHTGEAATPDKEREDLGGRVLTDASIDAQAQEAADWLHKNGFALKHSAVAKRIKEALSALSKARSAGKPECSADHSKYIGKCPYCHTALPGPSKDERDAVIEECAQKAERQYLHHAEALGTPRARNYEHASKKIAEAIRALKHSPKAGQEDANAEYRAFVEAAHEEAFGKEGGK